MLGMLALDLPRPLVTVPAERDESGHISAHAFFSCLAQQGRLPADPGLMRRNVLPARTHSGRAPRVHETHDPTPLAPSMAAWTSHPKHISLTRLRSSARKRRSDHVLRNALGKHLTPGEEAASQGGRLFCSWLRPPCFSMLRNAHRFHCHIYVSIQCAPTIWSICVWISPKDTDFHGYENPCTFRTPLVFQTPSEAHAQPACTSWVCLIVSTFRLRGQA